jgi:putative ATP-dependent endonuclease of OLD family
MYLKEFIIKNFRNIEELHLRFSQGVNVIIGENNSGKSAIVDALRICLSHGEYDRDIYIKRSDYYIDNRNLDAELPKIEFDLFLEIEDPREAGWFRDLLVQNEDGSQELQMHHRYYYETINEVEKRRRRIWGGEHEGQQIESDVLDLFKQVYLSALRDAVKELRPVRGNKLGELYSKLKYDSEENEITEEKRDELSDQVRTALHENEGWKNLIDSGLTKVNDHLDKTSIKGKEQEVEIDFLPFEFRKLVDYLRIQIPVFDSDLIQGNESKQKYFDLFQNGLGYNNLIYTAAVLGDLKVIKEVEPEKFIALIIEEPEAHLHPQLQNIFFEYLSKLDNQGFQLFISSHSPTLTAKANLDSLIILQNQNNTVTSFTIIDSTLEEKNKRYLSKFLDVTKSQLFFSNGIVLVEGISEVLLLQIFSELIGENNEFSLEKKGAEIVNINGVAFEHFAKLFNDGNEKKRMQNKCSIITDDDRHKESGEKRAQKAINLKSGNLDIFLAEKHLKLNYSKQVKRIVKYCLMYSQAYTL